MQILNSLIEWTKNTFVPLGAWGLFILAFMESSFFPIPPDVLLIVLTLAKPEYALFYALICTVGSVLGALLGYWIGRVGGQPLIKKLFKESTVEKVHNLFQKYEAWAIGIAGFTPIPYKVFTILGGVFYINIPKFIIASVISRGLRFLIVALLVGWFGQSAIDFINNNFEIATILLVLIIIGCYILYKRYSEKVKSWF
ncbi:DedA family protein [Candidatus Woesearchaeota archaeon]|nr:hypothetical protein [uncultured archaeon]MBS3167273.1 DedA family protein [Candidatus Woesearchaeota archaeon]